MPTPSTILSAARRFPDADALAMALADGVAGALRAAVDVRGTASLVVSGGSTPVPFFRQLAATELPWASVMITLADERWVAENDPQSNARLVRDNLLRGAAAEARFISLKTAAADPFAGAEEAAQRLREVPRPFDVVILGMGEDGHTASLFPHSPQLGRALDEDAPPCFGVHGTKPPRERITLTRRALLDSRWIVLHIGGEAKWRVLEQAAQPGPVADLPVRAVLQQRQVPVHVYCSA